MIHIKHDFLNVTAIQGTWRILPFLYTFTLAGHTLGSVSSVYKWLKLILSRFYNGMYFIFKTEINWIEVKLVFPRNYMIEGNFVIILFYIFATSFKCYIFNIFLFKAFPASRYLCILLLTWNRTTEIGILHL